MIDITLLNPVELDTIENLRDRVKTVLPPDMLEDRILIYRFLKARDFNLDRAEKMLRKYIRWRKHYQMSSIHENFKPKEFFVKLIQPRQIGYDKEGNIIMYLPAGNLNVKDILKCATINDLVKHCVWFAEKCYTFALQHLEKGGKKTFQYSAIFDLNGLTFANATSKESREIMLRLLHILQDNYPESIRSFTVINASSYYVILYTLLKPLLSAAFLKKVHIYGTDGWKEKLLESIDADVLPAFMGGHRTDPDGDPLCKTFIKHGGWMPKCYYLTDEERDFKDKSRITKVTLSPSSKEEVSFDVTDEELVIRWEFMVKNKDIAFGLFFEGSEGTKEILPCLKYDTEDGVEIGYYKAKSVGKYIVAFDNSHSWLTYKEIEYCITLLKTEQC